MNSCSQSSLILSMTPVVSRKVSTNRIVPFAKGDILLSMLSIKLWLIWDMIMKKNLFPIETSLSTHILPCMSDTRHFEINSPRLVLLYFYLNKMNMASRTWINDMYPSCQSICLSKCIKNGVQLVLCSWSQYPWHKTQVLHSGCQEWEDMYWVWCGLYTL